MAQLEDLKQGSIIEGVAPGGPVTVIDVQWFGSDAVELTYKGVANVKPGVRALLRNCRDDAVAEIFFR